MRRSPVGRRVKAAEQDKSLSRFLAELLEERMRHEKRRPSLSS